MDLEKIIADFKNSERDQKKYMIVIQGGSSSGKTTIAGHLSSQLNKHNVPNVLIPLDNYYKTFTGTKDDVQKYDFDNPAALDWEAIRRAISDFADDSKETATISKYSFMDRQRISYEVPNNRPAVFIIEGIFAMNVVNEMVFNIEEFDPYNSSKKIENEFIKNTFDLTKFNILKIGLFLSEEKMRLERCKRDVNTGNFTADESLERFSSKIWPATVRWVQSPIFKYDIEIHGGTFNLSESSRIAKAILTAFNCYAETHSFDKCILLELQLNHQKLKNKFC